MLLARGFVFAGVSSAMSSWLVVTTTLGWVRFTEVEAFNGFAGLGCTEPGLPRMEPDAADAGLTMTGRDVPGRSREFLETDRDIDCGTRT